MPAQFRGNDVTEYMRGQFTPMSGERVETPLLVKFPVGKGTVIFTSFHNETVNSKQEEKLLKHLVFAAVTAKEEAVADKVMLSGGFSATKRSLDAHSAGNPIVARTYTTTKAGPVRFALTFASERARLRFTLAAPNGQKFEKEATSTLVVEATGASAGEWTYTVTALDVPFENFPYGVSVGEVSPVAGGALKLSPRTIGTADDRETRLSTPASGFAQTQFRRDLLKRR